MSENIYLIGFMGTGKSTVGRMLAKQTNRKFVDTDQLVEEKAGMKITEIFEKYEEPEFRKLESEVLKSITEEKGLVVSTGGGIVTSLHNMEIMQKSGKLITLIASPEAIFERVKDSKDRPLLETGTPLDTIKQMLYDRAHFYIKGDHIIDTSELSAEEALAELMGFLGHA